MVKMSASYTGGLRCALEHGPSHSHLETDAPKDNHGKGEKFSPTDLVGAALASCALTTLALWAERGGISVEGAKAEVEKAMAANPRRIDALPMHVTLPASIPGDKRPELERVTQSCPVALSLHPSIKMTIRFSYVD